MSERTILNKLALERCEFHLSQLCALAHSFRREQGDLSRLCADNFFNIVKAMNEDIKILHDGLGIGPDGGVNGNSPKEKGKLTVLKNK